MKHLHSDKQPNRHYSLGMDEAREALLVLKGMKGCWGQRITPPNLPDSSLAVGMWSKVGGCPTLTPPQSPNPECMAVNTCTHTHTQGNTPTHLQITKTVRRKNKVKEGEKCWKDSKHFISLHLSVRKSV